MGTKLYVANLPTAASTLALREHFSACGVVSDVQLMPDRNSGRGRDSAVVRMSSPAGAERARAELHGAPFEGQLLVVEAAPDEPGDRRERASRGAYERDDQPRTRRAASADDDVRTRITQQFREAANMTYELDCSGVTVVVRVSFADPTGQWRVSAQTSRDSGAPSSAAAAASRIEAFRALARSCREGVDFAALGQIDWDAVEKALLTVRAI